MTEATDNTDKKASKKAAKKTAPEGYTLAEFAKDLKIDPVEARKALRGLEAKKPEGGRWVWPNKAATESLGEKVKEWVETDGRAGNAGRPSGKAAKKAGGAAPAKKQLAKKTVGKKLKKAGSGE